MNNQNNKTIRYVITHIGKSGLRTLTFGAQGRNTFPTELECETFLNNCKDTGLPKVLTSDQLKTLKVVPCECWASSHDPVGIYFD